MKRILLFATLLGALAGCAKPTQPAPSSSSVRPDPNQPDILAVTLVQEHVVAGITEAARVQLLERALRNAGQAPTYIWSATPQASGYLVSVKMTFAKHDPITFNWNVELFAKKVNAANSEAGSLERAEVQLAPGIFSDEWMNMPAESATPTNTP